MKYYPPRLKIKTGILIFFLFIPITVFSQSLKGKVLSGETKSGIGFVDIGIIGKNTGTVSDESGNFTLDINKANDNDSIRFSMIGYESRTLSVGSFKQDSMKNVFLAVKTYDILEIKITYHRPKIIRLGSPVASDILKSGFANNELGSEMGIKVHVSGAVKLTDLNLNVATCTFDSVTYRLNIYQLINDTESRNILTKPVYISFSKDKISRVVTFDLSKYSIIIEGDFLITLELYKDLGEGSLLFNTEFFTGTTYHKKTSEGSWTEAPGVIGMFLHGQLLRKL